MAPATFRPSGRQRTRAQSGFNLSELLVVLTVLGTLAAIGPPAYLALLGNTRVVAATNEMFATLFYTRTEAIKRNRRVTLCTSSDGQFCAKAAHWHDGWIVFEDANGDGVRQAHEDLLRAGIGQHAGVGISGNAPVRDYVSYVPSGMSRRVSGALQMGTLSVCGGVSARSIVISASGRPRVEKGGNC